MRNKKINIQEEEKNTLAYMQKLQSIKRASKDIKDRNKLTVHKVEWAKEFKYLSKLERTLERDTALMFQDLDQKFSKEFEENQIFGRQNQKTYTELNKKHRERVDVANTNLWFQIDSLRSVIDKLKQAPEFYEAEEVRAIVQNIRQFLTKLGEALRKQNEQIEINTLDNNQQQEVQSAFSAQKMLFTTQVKGFDVKKQRVLKMTYNQNIFKDLLAGSNLEIEEDDQVRLLGELNKAMGFLEERYELEFEKLELDYQETISIDPRLLEESQNYSKLCHIHSSYIGRGKDRGLFSERLTIQFPEISRKNLEMLTAHVEGKLFKTKKKRILWRNFYRQKSQLIDKAEQQLMRSIEQKIVGVKAEAQKLQRRQEQIKLTDQLVILRSDYEKKKKIKQVQLAERQKQRKLEEEKEEKLWKEHAEEINLKADQFKKQTLQKKRQSEIIKKQQETFQRELVKKKIVESKPKVQVRQSIERRKVEQKLEKKQETITTKIRQQERIQSAIRGYSHRPVVDNDPQRLVQPTESLKSKKVEYDMADKVDLVKVHGYSVNQLMSDMRYKLNVALQDAGLASTSYAKEVISQMSRPKEG